MLSLFNMCPFNSLHISLASLLFPAPGRPTKRRHGIVFCLCHYQRDSVYKCGEKNGQDVFVVICVVEESVALNRLEFDLKNKLHVATNRDKQVYLKVRDSFESLTDREKHLVVDTSNTLQDCVLLISRYLQSSKD